jgi:hypothetical protein
MRTPGGPGHGRMVVIDSAPPSFLGHRSTDARQVARAGSSLPSGLGATAVILLVIPPGATRSYWSVLAGRPARPALTLCGLGLHPCSARQPGLGDQSSSGKEALMTVEVGMEVHPKRSQIAIVDAAGTSSATATWPMTRSSWCRSLACWRRARRSPSRPPRAGLAGGVVGGTGAGTVPGPPSRCTAIARPGSRTTRSTQPPWPSCWGPTCSPSLGRPPEIGDLRARLRHRASLVRLAPD